MAATKQSAATMNGSAARKRKNPTLKQMGKYRCGNCPKTFPTIAAAELHLYKRHDGEGCITYFYPFRFP